MFLRSIHNQYSPKRCQSICRSIYIEMPLLQCFQESSSANDAEIKCRFGIGASLTQQYLTALPDCIGYLSHACVHNLMRGVSKQLGLSHFYEVQFRKSDIIPLNVTECQQKLSRQKISVLTFACFPMFYWFGVVSVVTLATIVAIPSSGIMATLKTHPATLETG